MTEKRFTALGSTHLRDNETDKEFYAPCEWDLLDLLNELHDENGQLRKEIMWWKYKYGEDLND